MSIKKEEERKGCFYPQGRLVWLCKERKSRLYLCSLERGLLRLVTLGRFYNIQSSFLESSLLVYILDRTPHSMMIGVF